LLFVACCYFFQNARVEADVHVSDLAYFFQCRYGSLHRLWIWFLDNNFSYKRELKDLVLNTDMIDRGDIISRFKKTGVIKLLVVSGIFIKENDSRTDILIVGENLKRSSIENVLRSIESEIGKELSYAFFDTKEFKYRVEMYDKFIYDVLDYPHERLVDKIGLPDKFTRL